MNRFLRALFCIAALLPGAASAQWIGGGGSGGGTGSGAGGTFTYSQSATTLTGTQFTAIGGGGLPTATEANVASKAATSTTIANLQVSLSAAPGGGVSLAITLRKAGVDQALTCTISGASATTCQDLTHLVTVAQNDLINWELVTTGSLSGTPTLTIQASNGAAAIGVTSVTGSGHLTCTPTTGNSVCSDSGLLVAANNLSDVTAATARTNLGLSGNSCAAGQYASGIDQQLGLTCSLIPLTSGVVGILPVANGGSGSNSPSLVAGTNITLSGSWPNQTINSTGGGSSGAFNALTSGTNTTATMIVGTGATMSVSGSGTISATAVPATGISGQVAVANGGTGTNSPALVAGSNITITGTWPNNTINATGGGGGSSPGGSTNDIQYNAGSSTFGGVTLTNGQLVVGQTSNPPLAKTVSGDATLSAGGALTVTKTNGTAFGALATTTPGTGVSIAAAIPLGTTGAFMTKGSSVCADLSNGATGCSTATGTSGATLPLLNGANTWSATQTFSAANPLLVGANSGNVGSIKLFGNTSGDALLTVPAIAGTSTRFQLPATNGSNTNVLQTDGSGNTSWVALGVGTGTVTSVTLGVPSSSIFGTNGTNPVTTSGTFGITTTGSSGGIPYFDTTSTLNSTAALAFGKIMLGGGGGGPPTTDASAGLVLGALSLGASGTAGSVAMGNATSGTVTLQPVAGALGAVTASLPANSGTLAELNLAQTWTAKQTFTASGPVEVGANGGNVGSVKLYGNTSGDATIAVPAIAGTSTRFQLPATNGSNTNVLQTDGSGNTSWATAATVTNSGTLTGGKVLIGGGTTVVTADASAGLVLGALSLGASGTAGSVAMGNATSGTVTLQPTTGALGAVTATLPANSGTIAELNLGQTWTAKQTMTGSGPLELGANSGNVGSVKLYGNSSGDATIVVPAAAGTATRFQLPATNGTSTNVLQTDGSGNTSWAAAGGAGAGVAGGQSVSNIGDNTTALPAGHYYYATNATMTVPRQHNLPDSGTQLVGFLRVCDDQRTVTSTNTLTLAAAGTDTLDGVTNGTQVIYSAGGCIEFENKGSGAYTTNLSNTTPTLTSAQVLVGNSSNRPAAVTLSGDITNNNAGAVTIANNAVTTAKINDAAVTYAKVVNGTGNALLRSNTGAAPSEATTGTGVITALGVNTGAAGAFQLNTVPYSMSAGWIATVNPNNVVVGILPANATVTSIVGVPEVATGGTSTVSVYKAPSGTACSGGTLLHSSGSINANGTAATNQTLTVTTSSVSSGNRICLQTTGTTGWTAGTGVGTVTVNYTIP